MIQDDNNTNKDIGHADSGRGETDDLAELVRRLELLSDPQIKQFLEEHRPEIQKIIPLIGVQFLQFQGPLPPPHTLEGYEKVLPGSAERIFAMAEKEQDHRHDMNKEQVSLDGKFLESDSKRERRGQYIAALLALIALLLSGFLAMNDHSAVASIIGGTTVLGLVSAFVLGRVLKPGNPPDDTE